MQALPIDTAPTPTWERFLITSNQELAEVCEQVSAHSIISLDCETVGLDPRTGRLRLVQIASRALEVTYLIDCFQITDFEPLKRLLMNSKIGKLMYNAAFDTKYFIHHLGVYIETPIDLFLGALLLNEYNGDFSLKKDFGLADVLKRYCNIELSKELQTSDWSGPELSHAQLDYAALDVEKLFPLVDKIINKIDAHGMTEAFAIENGCVLVTALMEYYGIKVDTDQLTKIGEDIDRALLKAQDAVGAYPEFLSAQQNMFDPNATINLESHPQVKQAFERRWKIEIDSTKAGSLKQHRDRDPELVDLYLDHSSLRSMKSNHVNGLLETINPTTGRVHSDFMQLASPQHRYRSRKPILLNIPKKIKYGPAVGDKTSLCYNPDRDFRSCFVPEDGYTFVIADYSQLQLRAIAQESGDPLLLKAYNEGGDVHVQTAVFLTGLPPEKIGKPQRALGKVGNFAISFMCSGSTLSETLQKEAGIKKSAEECEKLIDRYFRRYRGVAGYHKKQPLIVNRDKKVQVRGGRATLLARELYRDEQTSAVNFVMCLLEQSGIKKALVRLVRIFWNNAELLARIVLSPYDEIIVECSPAKAEQVKEILEYEMIRAMKDYIWRVPVTVESRISKSWG